MYFVVLFDGTAVKVLRLLNNDYSTDEDDNNDGVLEKK